MDRGTVVKRISKPPNRKYPADWNFIEPELSASSKPYVSGY
jgi:hypothetical protein